MHVSLGVLQAVAVKLGSGGQVDYGGKRGAEILKAFDELCICPSAESILGCQMVNTSDGPSTGNQLFENSQMPIALGMNNDRR
jgi:hypothetical protein